MTAFVTPDHFQLWEAGTHLSCTSEGTAEKSSVFANLYPFKFFNERKRYASTFLGKVQIPASKQKDACWQCWKQSLVKPFWLSRTIHYFLISVLKMARPLFLKLSFSWSLQPATHPNAKPKHLYSLQTFHRYTEVTCKEQQGSNIISMPVLKMHQTLLFAPSISLFLELLFHQTSVRLLLF